MNNIEAYFKISYGLYVVSSAFEEKKNGFIANSVFQVTAEPPQLAVACNKNNFTSEIIEKSGIFSISILRKEAGSEIMGIFGYRSGKDFDKFEKCNFKTGLLGAPILLDKTIAWFECKVNQKFDVGTHYIFVGTVHDFDMIDEEAEPLTYDYFRKVKKGKAPKNAPTYIDPLKITVPKPRIIYYCPACGYIYEPLVGDPEHGVIPGTLFEDIRETWVCPSCGIEKTDFITK